VTRRTAFLGICALLTAGALTSACVRLNEPDTFTCQADNDCLSTERCASGGQCAPKGTCDTVYDCGDTETCTNGKCSPAECSYVDEHACGGYACNELRHCKDHCAVPSDCKASHFCKAGACTPRGQTPNGVSCGQDEDCASLVCCGPPSMRKCSDGCDPTSSVCLLDSDCSDGHCCATATGRACSSSPCPTPPCKTNQDCATGYCDSGTCATPPCQGDDDCSTGYCDAGTCKTSLVAKGGTCKTDRWCQGGTCMNASCRGTAAEGAACVVDTDCAVGSQCCPDSASFPFYECSPQGRGCHQGIGASCDLDKCWVGDCYGDLLCSKACTSDADCGPTPTGGSMVCRLNGTGKRICFPTCNDKSGCSETAPFFTCANGVCSGDSPASQPQ
jgi:hypothetical protein